MDVLAVLVLGLGVGAAYAITAQGIVLIYRASRVVNFAQTGLALVGAYATYSLSQHGWPVGLALAGGLVLSGLAGVLIYFVVLRPLSRASELIRLVAVLGVLMILESIVELLYAGEGMIPPNVMTGATWHMGSVAIGANRIVLLIIGAVLALVLAALSRYIRFGMFTRAVAEDPLAFAGLGRSPDVVSGVNWFLGGALAGLAGALLAPIAGLSVPQLETLLLPALAAALVGRFRSFLVTFVTALCIGAASALVTWYLPNSGMSDSVPLLIIVVAMIIGGQGRMQRGEVLGRMPAVGTGRIRWWALLLIIPAVLLSEISNVAWASAIATTCATALILLSIVIITGYAGQLSLGQLAVAGVAALIAGKLSSEAGLPFLLCVVVTVACVIPIGILMGIPAFRSRGINTAIATLAIAYIVSDAVLSNPSLTGGQIGTMVKSPELFGWSIDPIFYPSRYADVTIVALFAGCVVVARLRTSSLGRKWLAVRSNERAAAALGVNVFSAKMKALCVAVAFAGLGGVLLAFTGPNVDFSGYTTDASISIVVLTVIGGVGYIAGALNGALIASGGLLSFVIGQYTSWSYAVVTLAAGVVVILNAISAPSGIFDNLSRQLAGLGRRLPAWTRSRWRPARGVATGTSRLQETDPGPLVAEDVSVRFGGVVALDQVSLRVERGEVVGLIGPNGAGKSTMIDTLSGFTERSQPGLSVAGRQLAGLSPTKRARLGVSRTFQSRELFEDMTLRDNLRVSAEAHRLSARRGGALRVSSACADALDSFGLEPYLDEQPANMPLAVRQLAGVARALAFEPAFVLLDEPAAGLDPPDRIKLSGFIRSLAADHGMGVLLIEHDVDLVMSTCDRVTALDFGRVIAEGTPASVRASEDVLRAYLGEGGAEDPEPGRPAGQSPQAEPDGRELSREATT